MLHFFLVTSVVEKYQDMPLLGSFGRHLNLSFFILELIAAFCLHEWFFVSLWNHRYVRYYTVLSCPVLSCPVLSCFVLTCLVLSCSVLSCFVLSCSVLSCFVLSCSVRSRFVVLSGPVLSYPSYTIHPTHHILFCQRGVT